jgi:hypothetical protein
VGFSFAGNIYNIMKRITLKESKLINLIKRVIIQEQSPNINNVCDYCKYWYMFNPGSVQDECMCTTCPCGSNPQTGPNTTNCQMCKAWYTFAPGSVVDNCECPTCPCSEGKKIPTTDDQWYGGFEVDTDMGYTSDSEYAGFHPDKAPQKLRLKESALVNLIKGVINEQFPGPRWQCEPTPLNGECNCIMVVTNAGAQMENNQFGSKEECENNLTLRDGTRNCCSGPVTKDDLKKHPKEPATKSIRLENHLSRRVINEQLICDPTTMCQKDCSVLVPQSWFTMADTKPCNWINNRFNVFNQRHITMLEDGLCTTCQYKRVMCKYTYLRDLKIQNGC